MKTSTLALFSNLRKDLPLPLRMGYGWLKRKMFPVGSFWRDKEYGSHYRWLLETQWWSIDQLEALQLETIQKLVKHAYENVPYYRKVFDENRVRPDDIVRLDDLQKLPLLTREDVRRYTKELIAQDVDQTRLKFATTGGSTGQPLGFYRDEIASSAIEQAYIHRQWSWAGYKKGDRIVTIKCWMINRADMNGKTIWWDYNADHNELTLSLLNTSEENLHQYVNLIRRFSPKYFNGYPSSLELLTRFMKRNKINDIVAKAAFCESETLYPYQRELIESQLHCKIFSGYGHAERAVDAVECEYHEGYHNNMEYGIIELLDKNDQPITQPGVLGKVVGTGLNTSSMPFIRYVTDDLAMYAATECSCGRKATLIADFKGRVREMVVTKSGNLIPFLAVYGLPSELAMIQEMRYLQEQEGKLVIEIVKASQYSEDEIEKAVLDDVHERLDKTQMDFQVKFVDQITRTKRGKIMFLEQKLPIRFEDIDCE